MKAIYAAGALAISLGAASPCYAVDLSGSYEAQFSVANSTQKPVCFVLSSTGAKRSFVDAGTVTSPTYPNYSGYYVVYKTGFHLTFLNGQHPLVTITGTISNGLLATSSATEFKASGEIVNVGLLTETKGCSAS